MVDTPRQPKKATTGPAGLEIRLRMMFTLPSAPGVSRWSGNHPVAGATVGFEGSSFQVTTDAAGNATIPVSAFPTSPFILEVRPDPSQQNNTGAAGPLLFKDATSLPRFAFRGFDAITSVDANGWETSPGPIVKAFFSPPNARVASVTPSVLTFDYKPDWIQSPNHDGARSSPTSAIVVHQTGPPGSIGSVINAFTLPSAKASAHYLVDLDGHVVKMVQDSLPSWHAGSSFWMGQKGLNDFSIGIENVHADQVGPDIHHLTPHPTVFPNEQYEALIRLLTQLRNEFPAATRQRVVGHGDVEIQGHGHNQIGTERPVDPGPMFEWTRLEAARVARTALTTATVPSTLYGLTAGGSATLSSGASSADVAQLKKDISSIGYSVSDSTGLPDGPTFSLALQRALSRFQTRFFSRGSTPSAGMVSGKLDYGTASMIFKVLQDSGP